jgi:hypothetical protein
MPLAAGAMGDIDIRRRFSFDTLKGFYIMVLWMAAAARNKLVLFQLFNVLCGPRFYPRYVHSRAGWNHVSVIVLAPKSTVKVSPRASVSAEP